MKVLIVGGVAGGAGAATKLRRMDETAEIILFEKGSYISYANCGLPYYIGGTISNKENLIVTKPELLRKRFNVDVRVEHEVIQINKEKKSVTVKNHADGSEYEESYDKLILSPGAEPKRPNMEGIQEEGILTLRTVPDTFKIEEYIKAHQPKKAVVIGGGFIGVEMAENLSEKGMEVSIVEFSNQLVATLDLEMASILHEHVMENGVELFLNTGVSRFEKKDRLILHLTSHQTMEADLVILSIGVAPESKLAKEAGLKVGAGGGIIVNERYETSEPDIYAVGDAIEVKHLVSGQQAMIPLAGPANKQGRTVAEAITGKESGRSQAVQGSAVLKVFELTAASTGMNEKQLKAANIAYLKTYVHPSSHASYYPGATQISMKLLFSEEGAILGAQAVGREGVEKRIDVIAAVLRLKGTVYDLEELELCYAPPFSSAKDPVNMIGFTASNILQKEMNVFYAEELDHLDINTITLVDVSTPDEFLMGTIPEAVNIPVDDLRNRLTELPKEKPVYLFCRVGLRGYVAARILMQHGYEVYNLSGGYKTYSMVKGKQMKPIKRDCIGLQKPEDQKEAMVQAAQASGVVCTIEVDACGLQCPGPIMKVSENMKQIQDGEQLLVRATDPAFASDIEVWCERTQNKLIQVKRDKAVYEVIIQKGDSDAVSTQTAASAGNDKTMVVFSGDLDKAIATFIIANGSAAMGRKVTLFFTFWGLNILRKDNKVHVKKNFIEKMFGMMMPRGSRKLGLSRMNMGGMGAKMIRMIMKKKNVQSLEELIKAAMDNGVRVVACQMSMDLMGIHQEELIDGVELGGVATFLGSAETSDMNLFI